MSTATPVNSTSAKYASTHLNTQGAGDARPTSKQIIDDEKLAGKWSDKVILITGCSSGIGVETARALHRTGATIYFTVRDVKRGDEVIADILSSNVEVSKSPLKFIKLELDSLVSVREAAAEFLKSSSKLNILINNAGVMACPKTLTRDGFEQQIGVNHFAHFLLFQLLKDTLIKSSTSSFRSRVITVSSSAHRVSAPNLDDLNYAKSDYNEWAAYGASKCANIWMANEIDRRYGAKGLHALSVHPGGILTKLARHVENDPNIAAMFASDAIKAALKSAEQGAATSVWAASSAELEGRGGLFLEDVSISKPQAEGAVAFSLAPGYAKFAYNPEGESKLWKLSNEAVGIKEE